MRSQVIALFALLWLGTANAQPLSGAGAQALLLSGTVVTGSMSAAVVVTLDSQGNPASSVLIREGDVISGYRLTRVEPDRALFERQGELFAIRLGMPISPSAPA